jgi:hypothetical protein
MTMYCRAMADSSPVHLLVWHVLIMPDTIRLQSLEVLITKSMKTN